MRKLLSVVLLSSLAFAVSAASAQAQITLGQLAPGSSPLAYCVNGEYEDLGLGQAGVPYTVPANGVITSWSTNAAAGAGQELTFKVYRPIGGNEYRVVGHDGPRTLVPGLVDTFPTSIPVQAGDLIGNNDDNASTVPNACLFQTGEPEDRALFAEGNFADGVTFEEEGVEEGLRLNETATLLEPPAISSIAPASGGTTGGTSVVIAGANFAEVKSVSFGSTPASSYAVNSEGQITAVSPAGAAGSQSVSVTTVAGTATSTQQFSYQAPAVTPPLPPPPAPTCTVPKLKGKSLKASKKKIRGADCKVGKLTKKKGAKASTGKVVGQSKKPGSVLPAGTVVKVTLGKG